jgi:putative transposase
MLRTISLSLPIHKSLRETIEVYNLICNLHIQKALDLNTLSKTKLHKSLYRDVRLLHPSFPSALIQCARDQAIEMLRGNKKRRSTTKKPFSSIRFDLRTCKVLLKSGKLSITTLRGRKQFSLNVPHYFHKYFDWKVKGATLGIKNKKLVFKVNVEGDNSMIQLNHEVLGIDLGLKNVVFLSNGKFVRSKNIRKVKRRYAHLRKRLQSQGTRSARRKLKKLSGRERRFTRDVNHQLSKYIAELDYGYFALENLKGIRKKRKGKKFNRMLGNWSFYELRTLLEYKAESLGKEIILVDPRYTSQQCNYCGFTSKKNRTKSLFKCQMCSVFIPADLNASRNISERGFSFLFEQAAVNQPIVTVNEGQRTRSRYQLQAHATELAPVGS